MKKLAILLTLAMLISSVAVFAAPQIDYMFYSEEDSTYYAFGSYDNPGVNSTATNRYDDPTDVGVYLGNNSDKFSLVKDNDTSKLEKSKESVEAKFGIGFKGYEEYFEDGVFSVTPYFVLPTMGEFKGNKREIDSTSSDYSPKKSSNADLESVTVYRAADTDAYTNAEICALLDPPFSPDVTTYTVKSNLSTNSANYAIDYKLADSKATTNGPVQGTKCQTITVYAEDGTEKTYTFNFEKNILTVDTNSIIASYSDTYLLSGGAYVNKAQSGKERISLYNVAENQKHKALITFNIKDAKEALKNAPEIGVTVRLLEYEDTENVKNLVFNAYGVTSGVNIGEDSISYDAATLDFTSEPVGELFVPSGNKSTDGAYKYTIDVTDYVKGLAESTSDYCTLAIELSSFDYLNILDGSMVEYRMYDYTCDGSSKNEFAPTLFYTNK